MIRTLACLCILLVVGCDSSKTESSTPPKEIVFEEFSILPFTIYETTGDCKTDTSRTCTRINVEYPLATDSIRNTAAEKINSQLAYQAANNFKFDEEPYSSVRQLVADFQSQYNELVSEFPSAFGWNLSITGEVLRNDVDYFVTKMIVDAYTGGAHGTRIIQYTNFSSVTGDVLTLDDILPEGYHDKLNQAALKAFTLLKGLKETAQPEALGYSFPNETYYNRDNFAYMQEELIFYFNAYEIAPYSEGVTELHIPLASIMQ